MKTNILFKISFLSLLIIGFCSCGDDDDKSDDFTNELVVKDVSYELSTGYLEYYGSNSNGSFDIDVTLISSTIQLVDNEFEGSGHFLYIDLNSTDAQKIIDGTYNYSETREAFSFVSSDLAVNYDLDTGDPNTGGEEFDINSGTVIITTIDETTTELTWSLISENGTSITGAFRGELKLK